MKAIFFLVGIIKVKLMYLFKIGFLSFMTLPLISSGSYQITDNNSIRTVKQETEVQEVIETPTTVEETQVENETINSEPIVTNKHEHNFQPVYSAEVPEIGHYDIIPAQYRYDNYYIVNVYSDRKLVDSVRFEATQSTELASFIETKYDEGLQVGIVIVSDEEVEITPSQTIWVVDSPRVPPQLLGYQCVFDGIWQE